VSRSGSYDPARTTAGGLAGEIDRLEAQAELSCAEELRVLRESGVSGSGLLLELGAGSGAVTRRLRAAMPDATIIALDIDETLLRHARDAGATLMVGDAARLPLRDGCADAVLLRYALQHIADPGPMLAEAGRVLRPAGRVVIIEVDSGCWGLADPVYPELAGMHAKVAAAQRAAGGDRAIGRRLTRLLRDAGFDQVALRLFGTTSDDQPMEAFAPHLGPQRLEPLLADGLLSFAEVALAADRWMRFRRNPDAWVMLVGFAAVGIAK
jgi:SAM-dependent methyltransferase